MNISMIELKENPILNSDYKYDFTKILFFANRKETSCYKLQPHAVNDPS